MIRYPSHLEDCVESASHIFSADETDLHKHYEIVCNCGSRVFNLWLSNKKSVKAECTQCSKIIVIYDLQFYPTAVKLPGDEQFSPMANQVKRPSNVFVQYEYGPPETDVPFDRNDITWCQIFACQEKGEIERVFDDETS